MVVNIAKVHRLAGNVDDMVFILGLFPYTAERLKNNAVVDILFEKINHDGGLFPVIRHIGPIITRVAENIIAQLIHLSIVFWDIWIHERFDIHGS